MRDRQNKVDDASRFLRSYRERYRLRSTERAMADYADHVLAKAMTELWELVPGAKFRIKEIERIINKYTDQI